MMVDIIIPSCKKREELQGMIDDVEKYSTIDHKLIAMCQPASAAINRNFGLDCSDSEIIIMIDDDITGFYEGWDADIIQPLPVTSYVAGIVMVSARCMNKDGSMAAVGHCDYDMSKPLSYIPKLKEGILPSSAIVFRKTYVRFDENIKGAGFDDADFCFEMHKQHPCMKFVVNNECQLIHLNRRQGYGGRKEYGNYNRADEQNLRDNRAYFYRKWYGIS